MLPDVPKLLQAHNGHFSGGVPDHPGAVDNVNEHITHRIPGIAYSPVEIRDGCPSTGKPKVVCHRAVKSYPDITRAEI